MSFLDGKKTYLGSALIIVLTGLWTLGYITDDLYKSLLAILGALTGAALRAGIKKAEK